MVAGARCDFDEYHIDIIEEGGEGWGFVRGHEWLGFICV